MNAIEFEQAVCDYLSGVLMMPTHAFIKNTSVVREIGENGICVVIYEGSVSDGKPPIVKRVMSASVVIMHGDALVLHEMIERSYSALQGYDLTGCGSKITVQSDEVSELDSGLFHGLLSIGAVIL